MKRLLSIIGLLVVAVTTYALSVTYDLTGTYVHIEGSDTLLIFNGDPLLGYSEPVDWYNLSTGALIQSNAEEVYLEDGTNVRLSRAYANDTIGIYHVYDYTLHHPLLTDAEVSLTCTQTLLSLPNEGNILPAFTYQTLYGQTKTWYIPCTVEMQNLGFNGESWVDTVLTYTERLQQTTYALDPLYRSEARIFISYGEISEALGLDTSEDRNMFTVEAEPIAVGYHPMSVTTVRGETEENEPTRPIQENQLTGSAPLDLLFVANPTPTAEYFLWRIWFGSKLLTQRGDENQRYEFNEPGTYRVVCYAWNSHCPCEGGSFIMDCDLRDSVELDPIVVNVSKLMVPNVFTPNGDGANDEFRVLYKSIATFKCEIFNRWGKPVYVITDPAKGWDGRILGRPAAEGAYYYVIRATGTDGVKYKLSGDINLIR